MGARVFEYGLLPPIQNSDLVSEQMLLAHRYRNKLVEIERERRTKVREALSSHPDVAPMQERLTALIAQRDEARTAIKELRKTTRKRSETASSRDAVTALNAEVRELAKLVKAQKADILKDIEVQKKLSDADDAANVNRKAARAVCGVYWGTYLLQEAAADQARKEVDMPMFKPYRGEGRVSVQIQHGITVDEVLECQDTRIRIAPVSPDAYDIGVRRGDRRRAQRTVLRMRVGSSDTGKPVWAEWPMIMHRPLPPGSVVKVATVQRRRRNCLLWAWRLHLTVIVPDDVPLRAVPAAGVVALNLGFCVRPDGGVRSGYLVGDDGLEQEVLAAKSTIYRGGELGEHERAEATRWTRNGLSKADSIRSFRDKNMDVMRPAFTDWVASVPETAQPTWFVERIKHFAKWKSADRFRRMSLDWETLRFDGDEAGFDLLKAWRERDEHLECYESGIRQTALRDRLEGYRIVAARMAARYRVLLIDDVDLRKFHRSPATESAEVEFDAVKSNMRLAAGSELRGALLNAFGARVVKLSGSWMTARCAGCGVMNDVDRSSGSRIHACSGCGERWDQDANFCRNLLAEHARSESGSPTEGSARTTRWGKIRAKAAAQEQLG